MSKNKIFLFSAVVIVLIGTGCSATKNVKVKSYIEDRPRVDQELSGNAGYLAGTGSKQQPGKPTRKVIVVEVNKEVDPNIIADIDKKSAVKVSGNTIKTTEESTVDIKQNVYPKINLPVLKQESSQTIDAVKNQATSDEAKFIDYVVEKDDTLQKLSKKFYNSYSKWTKIYEANKALIKNPDFIKPGITLKIPTE